MKYVIVETTNVGSVIVAVTEHPIKFVASIEPIDVLNGRTIAWDSSGDLYNFGLDKILDSARLTKNITVTDVGKWEVDEPVLIKVASNEVSQLRDVLVEHLKGIAPQGKSGRWFFKKKNLKIDNYSELSINELIVLVESTLK